MMLESTADNVLLDAMREATGTELSFINGWRYGAPIPAGPITLEAIYNLVPMNPEISTVTLSGAEVWSMIEENLERTFSRDPFGQMGGYVKRCGGLKAYFKVENPSGSRLQALFVGESKLDPARRYTASFVTMQAVPGKYGTDRQGTGLHLVESVASHLQRGTARFEPRQSFLEL
jgi:sulfur-oxidizing protein SoxB